MNRIRRLLRAFGYYLLARVQPSRDEIDVAVSAAFADCGLNSDSYQEEFNLRNFGKFWDVLSDASNKLGNPLQTVADLKALLR